MRDKLARILGVASQNLTDDDLLEMVRSLRFKLLKPCDGECNHDFCEGKQPSKKV